MMGRPAQRIQKVMPPIFLNATVFITYSLRAIWAMLDERMP